MKTAIPSNCSASTYASTHHHPRLQAALVLARQAVDQLWTLFLALRDASALHACSAVGLPQDSNPALAAHTRQMLSALRELTTLSASREGTGLERRSVADGIAGHVAELQAALKQLAFTGDDAARLAALQARLQAAAVADDAALAALVSEMHIGMQVWDPYDSWHLRACLRA